MLKSPTELLCLGRLQSQPQPQQKQQQQRHVAYAQVRGRATPRGHYVQGKNKPRRRPPSPYVSRADAGLTEDGEEALKGDWMAEIAVCSLESQAIASSSEADKETDWEDLPDVMQLPRYQRAIPDRARPNAFGIRSKKINRTI